MAAPLATFHATLLSVTPFPPPHSHQPLAFQSSVSLSHDSNSHNLEMWFSALKILQFKPFSAATTSSQPSTRLVVRARARGTVTASFHLGTEICRAIIACLEKIGFSESEAGILIDSSPAIRLLCVESLRPRVLSLQSVGIDGLALRSLIMKRPDVLTAEEIDPLIRFVREYLGGEVEAARLVQLLRTTEPRLLVGFDTKVGLLLRHGIPREKLSHVLNNVNLAKAVCLKPPEEIERTLSLLDRLGGSSSGIIIRRPAILHYDLDNQLIPRIKFLTELSGGDVDAVGAMLRKLPAVLAYSVEHVEGQVEFLSSIAGLTREEIFKVWTVFPSVIGASKEKKLHPRISFLKQCGLMSDDIFRFLTKSPLFLGLSFEGNLAFKLSFLVKIGFGHRTKELALAMGASSRTSCENLQKVVGLLLSYGLSCQDIVSMTNKHPQILQYNCRSLEDKMEYLIDGMGREVGELLAFPAFLGYKLDERIKHRYDKEKKIRGKDLSLNNLLTQSTKRFDAMEKKRALT